MPKPCKAMGNLKSDTLLFLNSDRRQERQEFQTKNSSAIPHDPQNPESWKSEGKSQMLDGLKSYQRFWQPLIYIYIYIEKMCGESTQFPFQFQFFSRVGIFLRTKLSLDQPTRKNKTWKLKPNHKLHKAWTWQKQYIHRSGFFCPVRKTRFSHRGWNVFCVKMVPTSIRWGDFGKWANDFNDLTLP